MSARAVLAVTTVTDDLQKFGRVMNPKRIRISRWELPPHTLHAVNASKACPSHAAAA